MNTEKKNQHYVPKFYLRNFSFENNKKQIGIYNINNEKYILKGKLKTQGSKNFFYGCDGIVEDGLANIEGALSSVIRDIILYKKLPQKNTNDYFELLLFATLTDLRNPIKIEGMKESFAEMKKVLLQADKNADVDNLIPSPSHDHLVKLSLSNATDMAEMILDLDCKLLINNTKNPFITSNFPIVKYNQYLEMKKWPHSKSGYGLTGLQIFIPINCEIVILFFDKDIYELGDDKNDFHEIVNSKDIDSINILQFLNCLDTIYFDEKATDHYINKLHFKSKKYKRAHLTRSRLDFLIKEGDEENKKAIEAGFKNFMQINKTDCETGLKLDGLNIHSKGFAHKLNNTLAQLRPHVRMMDKNNDKA